MPRLNVKPSPGIKKCAKGKTIKLTLAIDTPAKPEVTNCCPHASSMNGMAAENPPTTSTVPFVRRDAGASNNRPPVACQIATINTVAKPIRPAASQKGVRLSNANSVTMNVAPQVTPRIAIIAQLFHVIWGLSVMQRLAVVRCLFAFCHAVVPDHARHAQSVIRKVNIPPACLRISVLR